MVSDAGVGGVPLLQLPEEGTVLRGRRGQRGHRLLDCDAVVIADREDGEPDMAGLPDGVWGGCGDDHRASPLYETEYHGGAPASFLPDIGEREKDAAQGGVGDLLRAAAALFGVDYPAVPADGVGHLRDIVVALDGTLHNEVQNDENQ